MFQDGGDGHVLELRGRVLRDDDGVVRGTGLVRDVTQIRAAEAKLRANETRFRQAFQDAPVAIALTSPTDVLVDVNAAFERLTGYGQDELLGKEARKLGFWSSPEDQKAVSERLRGETPTREPLTVSLRTKSGRVREALLSITPGPLDHLGGYVKVLVDVTERLQSQRKLVQARRDVMQDTSWLAQGLVERLEQLDGDRVDGPSLAELTQRERQVLSLVAEGLSNEQVAERLGLATSTVRNYVSSLYLKLGVDTRAAAVVWARDRGLGGE